MLLFFLLLAFESIIVLRTHYHTKLDDAEADCPQIYKMKYKNIGGTKSFTIKKNE